MQLHVRDGTRNIGIIEKNLQELEGKLQYETNKLQGYSADLKEAERRCDFETLYELFSQSARYISQPHQG